MKKDFTNAVDVISFSVKYCLKIFKNRLILLLLLFSSAGCKKIIEKPGLTGICPEVISTSPMDTATQINRNTVIVAVFNEVMDPATLTAATFILRNGATPIAGTIVCSGINATFTPTANLEPHTQYTGIVTTGAKDPAGNALVKDYVWHFTTGDSVDVFPPTVISTDPANAATGVLLDKKITATFSKIMNPLTINTSSFVLKQGSTSITGAVTYSGVTATFSPTVNLISNTTYTATITTGAKDLAGNALVNNYVWSFTTGTTTDVTPPTIIATSPANGDTGVLLNKIITATFSEAMNPSTINTTSFILKQGVTPIAGTVTYTGVTASFTPSANLSYSTVYTATVTTAAKDLAGNAMVSNYVWSFTTLTQIVPPPPLGTIANFGAFGGNAGITNQGLNTVINNGGIGTTAASTLITGFHDATDIYTETPLNVGNVTGVIYTAPPPPGTAAKYAIAVQALADANTAYNSISPASKPGGTDPGAGQLGGLTLPPGIYKSASGTFNITSGNLILDAGGNPNAVWIFQTAAGLTVGVAGPSGAKSVVIINGGQAKNVFWYVGSAAVINSAGGGIMSGTIISSAGVTFSTAGNTVQTVLNGRAISLVASVTMVNTTINNQ